MPPFISNALRRQKSLGPEFRGVYRTFAESGYAGKPWDSEERSEKCRLKLEGLTPLIRDARKNGVSPTVPFGAGMSTLLLILNQLSRNKSVRVLDFGGGTGLHYYNLHPLLRFPENVHWHVVDSARLADIGKPFQEESHRITFSDALPESARFDLLHISSTLHYIEDYPALLEKLLGYEPQWVHLVRLHAGDVPTHVTVQKVRGTDTPIIVPNFDELSAIFHGHSYDLVAKGPVESEDYDSTSFAEDVPPSHRIPHSLICSFIRRDSE